MHYDYSIHRIAKSERSNFSCTRNFRKANHKEDPGPGYICGPDLHVNEPQIQIGSVVQGILVRLLQSPSHDPRARLQD